MAWIFAGFLTAICIEMLIRVLSTHQRPLDKETHKTQVSFPWYGWGLLGLLTWGVFKKDKH